MSLYYEMTLPIDSRDVDGNGFCKASSLLGHIQEAAAQAAERGGFGRDMTLNGYRAFWMLTRVWYRLRRPLGWEEPLTIRTWHRGDKGATMYRDYDLFVRGEQVGECVSAWVLASLDSRQLIRLGTVRELDGTSGGALCKAKKLSKLRLPQDMAQADRRKLRYSPATPWRWRSWGPAAFCRRCRSAIWPSAAPGRSCASSPAGRETSALPREWTRAANPALRPP